MDLNLKPLYATFLILLSSDPDLKPQNISQLYYLYINRLLYTWESTHRTLPFDWIILEEGFYEIGSVICRAQFGISKDTPSERYILSQLKQVFGDKAIAILNFWIDAGVFYRQYSNNEEVIHTHSLDFIFYAFAFRLAKSWNARDNRKDLLRELRINLKDILMNRVLTFFVYLIDDPENFLSLFYEELKEYDYNVANSLYILTKLASLFKTSPIAKEILGEMKRQNDKQSKKIIWS